MIEEIKEKLESLAVRKNKEFNSKIVITKLPILGINIPTLRKIAKEINQMNFHQFLKEYDESSYELALLKAYVIATAKMDLEERFKYLEDFIPTIDNWAVHDGLVSSLKCTKKHMLEMRKFILKYQNSNHEYEVRFVAVMLMTYYMEEEYLEENLKVIQNLNIKAYYAKMGVAWFLATAMIDYPQKTLDYLMKCDDVQLIRMTIRKIKDSYRISPEMKDRASTLLKNLI